MKYICLRWKLKDYLYSTEVVERPRVTELIKNLDTLMLDFGLPSVYPITEVFHSDRVILQDIRDFLAESLVTCEYPETDLPAAERILGPSYRHGPEITRELTEITRSIIKGGGKYDHLKVLDEFLKSPYHGVSAVDLKAIKAARTALAGLRHDPIEYGQRTMTVADLLEVASEVSGNTPVRVMQDDGMGYGAINGLCTEVSIGVDPEGGGSELRVWM